MQQKQKHELEDKPGNFKQLLEKLKTKLKKTHKKLENFGGVVVQKKSMGTDGPWISDLRPTIIFNRKISCNFMEFYEQ